MKRASILFIIVIAALAVFLLWRPSPVGVAPNASLESLLVDDGQVSESFARATVPDDIQFPRDLGPHDDYQTEWWYYTGNLQTEDGRPFGYQFTIFRRALAPEEELNQPEDPSAWRGNQVYLAHFTISDIGEDAFFASERFSRGAGGLAGASAEPYQVWLEDWSVEEIGPGEVRLQAQTDEVALDLRLTETLPPVLHGEGGLSQKGLQAGNASYYYSIVQQETEGDLTIGDESFAVNGLSWKDHEYSTSALSPGSVGWDWFSLQLDDGSALMLFQIRREDGSMEPASSGTFIFPDGTQQALSLEDWQLEVLDTWTSPTSGAEYPAAWRLALPGLDLTLEGEALMPNQELNVSTVYWEGAVGFDGQRAGQTVAAQGYIEMTGYQAPITSLTEGTGQ
jgi:predicted secreted hydrolase